MNLRFPHNRAVSTSIRGGETAGERSVEFIGTDKTDDAGLSNILLVTRAVTPCDFYTTQNCRHIMRGVTGMNAREGREGKVA